MTAASDIKITARREIRLVGASWTVTEFDGGKRYMLVCNTPSTQFHAHFTAKAWQEFQGMVNS